MPETTLRWHAEALREQLEALLPRLSVEVVASTTSTNSILLARASGSSEEAGDLALVRRSVESAAFGRREIDLQPCLLVAEHQSAGRGRQSRPWQSAAGASLTFSLALPLTVADWSGLSLAVGVALADALDPLVTSIPRIGLKWPNDLWLVDGPGRGRKLGGILIETVASGAQRLAVIGIGLNARPFDTEGLNTGFASCQELDPGASAPALLMQIALPLVQALRSFEREGFAAFAERFATRDMLRGHAVRATGPEALEGVARGVSLRGGLLVEVNGRTVEITSGEVSVRLTEVASC